MVSLVFVGHTIFSDAKDALRGCQGWDVVSRELLASLWPKDKSNMLDIGSDGLRLTAVEYCTILEAS